MRALVAHIGHIHHHVTAELVLDVKVPVLNIGLVLTSWLHPVGCVTILERGIDQWRSFEVLRESAIQQESRCDPVVETVASYIREVTDSVSGALSVIENRTGTHIINPIPSAEYSLVSELVGKSKARTELLLVSRIEPRFSVLARSCSRELKGSRNAACLRIG